MISLVNCWEFISGCVIYFSFKFLNFWHDKSVKAFQVFLNKPVCPSPVWTNILKCFSGALWILSVTCFLSGWSWLHLHCVFSVLCAYTFHRCQLFSHPYLKSVHSFKRCLSICKSQNHASWNASCHNAVVIGRTVHHLILHCL